MIPVGPKLHHEWKKSTAHLAKKDGRCQRTRAFTELQPHYLFDDR